jgi:hypothetical protein
MKHIISWLLVAVIVGFVVGLIGVDLTVWDLRAFESPQYAVRQSVFWQWGGAAALTTVGLSALSYLVAHMGHTGERR